MDTRRENLAISGGTPTHNGDWPTWPDIDSDTEGLVLDVLRGARWAISDINNGVQLYERRFAEDFARYNGVPYCVPTSSGTSALTIAFESLGLTRGAEVLVPGLTWVACASAVAACGLVPVLVDIDPGSLCMSVDSLMAAISPRTEAVLAVHYMCNMVDLDRVLEICQQRGLALVEDCAQAHGAVYSGRRVGSFGAIGAFSMQNSKVLTSGEGGACVTSDAAIFERMQQFRADGRCYSGLVSSGSTPDLRECGEVQGRNLCLSEIQAAVLLGRLRCLESQNERREAMASVLDEMLADMDAVETVPGVAGATRRTYYRYCLRFDLAKLDGPVIEQIRREIEAELSLACFTVHDPLNASPLYNPLKSPQKYDPGVLPRLDPTQFDLPGAKAARETYVTLPHRVLLGTRDDMVAIAGAVSKIVRAHRH